VPAFGLPTGTCCLHSAGTARRAGAASGSRSSPAPIPISVVYAEGRRAAARVRAFVDFAVERLRADPSLDWREPALPAPQPWTTGST
jgi:hypothetical protein